MHFFTWCDSGKNEILLLGFIFVPFALYFGEPAMIALWLLAYIIARGNDINQQYLKETDDGRLADLVAPFMQRIGVDVAIGAPLSQVVSLLKERVQTVEALAEAAVYFYRAVAPHMNDQQLHYTAAVHLPLMALHQTFESLPWERTQIAQAIKSVVAMHQLKFPQIAMPLRVMVSGGTQTPSVDVTLELIGRTQVLERMAQQLEFFPHLAAEH